MNRDRMELLLDVLAKIPPERFDIARWVTNPETIVDGGPTCGTIACAAGWLALDLRARAQGLTVEVTNRNTCTITLRGGGIFASLGEFLGLSHSQINYIFLPLYYSQRQHRSGVTPQVVARRVRALLKRAAADARRELDA